MNDIFAEIEREIERMGGSWTAYLVRALWPHGAGLSRRETLDRVLEDALNRGRATSAKFEAVIQSSFQAHNSGSAVFSGSAADDLFEFVGGRYSGIWRVRRAQALAWMAANGRACDFTIAAG